MNDENTQWLLISRYTGDVLDTSPSENEAHGFAEYKFGNDWATHVVLQGPEGHIVNGERRSGNWQWTHDEYVRTMDKAKRFSA